jgi:hypothetical protein
MDQHRQHQHQHHHQQQQQQQQQHHFDHGREKLNTAGPHRITNSTSCSTHDCRLPTPALALVSKEEIKEKVLKNKQILQDQVCSHFIIAGLYIFIDDILCDEVVTKWCLFDAGFLEAYHQRNAGN